MAKLLVVDDELEICDFLKNFFGKAGFEVFSATNGQEAISTIDEERPQIALLDIKMPGISGIEVLRRAKEIDHNIKIIMVTGVEDEEMVNLAKEYGASDYITKPFSLDYLENSVLSKLLALLS